MRTHESCRAAYSWSVAAPAVDFVFLNESVLGAVAFVRFLIKEPLTLFASCRHQQRLRLLLRRRWRLRLRLHMRLWQVGRSLLSLLIDCNVLSCQRVSNNLGFNYLAAVAVAFFSHKSHY